MKTISVLFGIFLVIEGTHAGGPTECSDIAALLNQLNPNISADFETYVLYSPSIPLSWQTFMNHMIIRLMAGWGLDFIVTEADKVLLYELIGHGERAQDCMFSIYGGESPQIQCSAVENNLQQLSSDIKGYFRNSFKSMPVHLSIWYGFMEYFMNPLLQSTSVAEKDHDLVAGIISYGEKGMGCAARSFGTSVLVSGCSYIEDIFSFVRNEFAEQMTNILANTPQDIANWQGYMTNVVGPLLLLSDFTSDERAALNLIVFNGNAGRECAVNFYRSQ